MFNTFTELCKIVVIVKAFAVSLLSSFCLVLTTELERLHW